MGLCVACSATMKTALFAALAVASLAGCSIHPRQQLAGIRAAGVHPETMAHLSQNTPLTPSDLIDLKKRGVSESVAIRHLDSIGVDYEVRKEDMERLRAANVPERVREALMRASDRFVYWRSYAPRPVFVDPFPWYEPVGFGFGYTYVRHQHVRRCR